MKYGNERISDAVILVCCLVATSPFVVTFALYSLVNIDHGGVNLMTAGEKKAMKERKND